MADSERYRKGAAKMKELFGVEPQPGSMHEDFLNITVENLFGDVWGRLGCSHQVMRVTNPAKYPHSGNAQVGNSHYVKGSNVVGNVLSVLQCYI